MDTSQDASSKGHTRTRSGVKATRPRSSTKGPLDDDGPLTSPLSADQVQRTLSLRSQPRTPGTGSPMTPRSPARSPAPTGRRTVPGAPAPRQGPKDFSYLLRPELYHALTPLNIPTAFRSPAQQPAPDTPLAELLTRGHFRAAAIAATQALTSGAVPPTDHAQIFDLFYTRLACLTLIDATPLAAQEVKALGDLHSAFYYYTPPSPSPSHPLHSPPVNNNNSSNDTDPEPTTTPTTHQQQQHHIVPWPLRVLAVRLQALGFADPRRAVMSYYELAREARTLLGEARAAHDHSAAEVWRARLADLGVRVAGALVEMEDLAGAVEHLGGLDRERGRRGEVEREVGGGVGERGVVVMREALLWLHLGDVQAARGCLARRGKEGVQERVVGALCDMADGEYEAALGKWAALKEEVDDEMVGVNMAVCLLYVGRMHEGKALLEDLVTSGRSSHTLLFNLTTMYELCTDRSRALKTTLSEKVAALGVAEKTNTDFKLQ